MQDPQARSEGFDWKYWGLLLFSAGILIYLIVTGIIGDKGIPETRRLESELDQLKHDNESLRDENEQLFREVEYRRSDTYLEEIIRTELGYARPGDTVIKWNLETPSNSDRKTDSTSGQESIDATPLKHP